VLNFHTYEAAPGAPGRPRKARYKAEARLSNTAVSPGARGGERGVCGKGGGGSNA
jgi:hypothetical protein